MNPIDPSAYRTTADGMEDSNESLHVETLVTRYTGEAERPRSVTRGPLEAPQALKDMYVEAATMGNLNMGANFGASSVIARPFPHLKSICQYTVQVTLNKA